MNESHQLCKLATLHSTHVHDGHVSLQTNCAQFLAAGPLPISGFVSEDTLGFEASCRVALAIAKERNRIQLACKSDLSNRTLWV